jgi:hypothetical protein
LRNLIPKTLLEGIGLNLILLGRSGPQNKL